MTSHSIPLSTLALVSRALLSAVDGLADEFPDVPLAVVYDRVGDARPIAARKLPNVNAYRCELERRARVELRRVSSVNTANAGSTCGNRLTAVG
jgi:hypothetical protein